MHTASPRKFHSKSLISNTTTNHNSINFNIHSNNYNVHKLPCHTPARNPTCACARQRKRAMSPYNLPSSKLPQIIHISLKIAFFPNRPSTSICDRTPGGALIFSTALPATTKRLCVRHTRPSTRFQDVTANLKSLNTRALHS
jgi:hypothetical protein